MWRIVSDCQKTLWGGSEGRRSATSIVAADAGRALRSFRLTPPGRFGPFGAKCPGCSIIRTFLTVVLMVSLPRSGSLCHLRWQQPTGLARPSAPQGWRFPPRHRAHTSLRPLRMKSESSDMRGGFGSLAQQGSRFPGRAAGAGETCPVGKDRRRRAFSTR